MKYVPFCGTRVGELEFANRVISDLLARLGLKARFMARRLMALASKFRGQGQHPWLPVALAYRDLQATALYV